MFNCRQSRVFYYFYYFSLTKFVYDKKSIFGILYQTKFSVKKIRQNYLKQFSTFCQKFLKMLFSVICLFTIFLARVIIVRFKIWMTNHCYNRSPDTSARRSVPPFPSPTWQPATRRPDRSGHPRDRRLHVDLARPGKVSPHHEIIFVIDQFYFAIVCS